MRFVIIAFLCFHVTALLSQTPDEQVRSVYELAESSYNIGRIEDAQRLLTGNLRLFSGSLRQSAYRMLSLCSLGLDDAEAAEEYVRLLLLENPYYSTTASDPQRFIDMVERISGRSESTITTASSHEERFSEVPVPTTLITEQMIRDSGARNLQEVLATYVPGMNIVDCNDNMNIAMRGIFSVGQEKILIMLDGHRLNSYSNNVAAPDFSISLDKLRQIEVLRGPASSLYGGVALTAVVNLITKRGGDVDGLRARAAWGTYGQLKGDALFGKRYYDLDILLWGSLYKASGEARPLPPTSAAASGSRVTVGGIGRKPTYDLGLTLRWKDVMFTYDTHFSQVRSPYTISTTASPYDYGRYSTHDGLRPGFATSQRHLSLKYSRQTGKVTLGGTVGYDIGDLTQYQVISDNNIPSFGDFTGLDSTLSKLFEDHVGMSRHINEKEQTISAQLNGEYNYLATGTHSGYLNFGAEFSHFQLDDMNYSIGYDFVYSTPTNPVLSEVGKGSENSYNAYVQLKHQWGPFILNAGLRYDHKVRFDKSRVNEYSPRVALIFVKPRWNMKFSYSKSFVDAPYLYQKTNQFNALLNNSTLSEDPELVYYNLKPETLHSLQLTFAGTRWLTGLDFELNLFYNRANDLIFTEIISQENSGKNHTIGSELMASYRCGPLSANLSAAWIHTYKAGIIYKDFNDNNSTPDFTSNLVLAWQASRKLRLHANALLQTSQTAYNISFNTLSQINLLLKQTLYDKDVDYTPQQFDVITDLIENKLVATQHISPRIVLNLGAEYRIGKVTLGLDVHNLLDKSYYQSGMNTGLVPQRGRWLLATAGLEL